MKQEIFGPIVAALTVGLGIGFLAGGAVMIDRITRTTNIQIGMTCSINGSTWFPARNDGMCHAEDAPK